MAEDISDTILENAQGPKRATGDSGSIEQHPLRDVIAVERHRASKDAAPHAFARLLRSKLVPPGAS